MKTISVIGFAAIFLSGCTDVQLRRDSGNQAAAIYELQQQQVLDNLARFCDNPNAVPYFTAIDAGSASVSDTGSGSTNPLWNKLGFLSGGFTLTGSRINQELFSLNPITDPFQLSWMQSVYQFAIGYPNVNRPLLTECCCLESEWIQGGPCACPCNKSTTFYPACNLRPEDCLPQPPWFQYCRNHDSWTHAKYVGHCNGMSICVPPEFAPQLSRLTMMIIGIASTKRGVTVERKWTCDCPAPAPKPSGDAKPAASQPSQSQIQLGVGNLQIQTQELPSPQPPAGGATAGLPSCTVTETTTVGQGGSTSSNTSSGNKGSSSPSKSLFLAPQVLPVLPLQ